MKNIKENNQIIAEFMGDKISYGCKKSSCACSPIIGAEKGCENSFSYYSGQYEQSWDWLMPVVEKIEEVEIDRAKILLEMIGKRAKFIGEYGCRYFNDSEGETKLEATYIAVVEFIKWYNEKKED